jgi:hypothetical protein
MAMLCLYEWLGYGETGLPSGNTVWSLIHAWGLGLVYPNSNPIPFILDYYVIV